MKKILSYCMLIMLACCTFLGCKKGDNYVPQNELDGTTWSGISQLTTVTVSFVGDECHIVLTGYATGSAVGSYTVDGSNVSVTIASISGSSAGLLHEGDVINGTFDLNTKKMTVNIGNIYQLVLDKK